METCKLVKFLLRLTKIYYNNGNIRACVRAVTDKENPKFDFFKITSIYVIKVPSPNICINEHRTIQSVERLNNSNPICIIATPQIDDKIGENESLDLCDLINRTNYFYNTLGNIPTYLRIRSNDEDDELKILSSKGDFQIVPAFPTEYITSCLKTTMKEQIIDTPTLIKDPNINRIPIRPRRGSLPSPPPENFS